MFDRKIKVLCEGLLAILFIGLGVFYNHTGRVRPHYTNTLYVEWDETTMDDGTQRPYIAYFLGPVGVWRKEDFSMFRHLLFT